MTATHKWVRLGTWLVFAAVILALPQIFTSGYMTNAMIDSVRWIIFALSFDLVAGHIGAVSLGHPAFFGMGAYVTAILASTLGLGFTGSLLLSAGTMAIIALITGVAFFRIRGVTFAIGTMGAIIIAQLFANNAYDLTGGPLCVKGIARPELIIPFTETTLKITKPIQYYYLLLPLLLITILIYKALTTSRIGRAFTAVREDEIRASAVGIYPLRYKLLAFAVGAGIVGALGSFQAQYVTIVCPSEISQDLMTTLLIIVFVGGVSQMRGIIIGAIIFSSIPRLLEAGGQIISPALQQVAYGLILMLVMTFLPDGLDGFITRLLRRSKEKKATPEVEE